MIDGFEVDGQYLALSHGTTQVSLPEKASLLTVAQKLSEYKLHYYTKTDDLLFMDHEAGLCLAAQIAAWTDKAPADEEYHVFVPGDNAVYYARVNINPHFVSVTTEELLDFQGALNVINQYPAQSLVHDSGQLATQFQAQEIEVEDLGLEVFEGGKYSLAYGINQQQLMLAGVAPLVVLALWMSMGPLLGMFGEPDLPAVITGPPPEAVVLPTEAPQRLGHDLVALSEIMNVQALLVLHGMSDLTISPQEDLFSLRAAGALDPNSTIVRLHNIAMTREADFFFDGNAWTMSATHPRQTRYASPKPDELANIYVQLDKWRLTAALHNIGITLGGREELHDAVRYRLQMTMDAPHPVRLQTLIDDLERQQISGDLTQATLSPGSQGGMTWSALTLEYTITGVEP